jgi:O-antigen ligase
MNPAKAPSLHATLDRNGRRAPPLGRDLGLFALFVLVGGLLVLYPSWLLACAALVATVGLGWLVLGWTRRAHLEIWQVLVLAALSGYTILNYGFENLAIHLGGVPIIISYLLMFASLGLAVLTGKYSKSLQEPTVYCLLGLFLLTLVHLVVDVPAYGLWALRDASMFLDGLFLFLGLCWGMRPDSTIPLMKWLLVMFVLNLVYALSFPWGDALQALSPVSGVFLKVPVLGYYHSTYIYLLGGAMFFIMLAGYIVKWPKWIMLLLVFAQLGGLAIHQDRSMYVAIALIIVLLLFFGEVKTSATLLGVVVFAITGLFLLTTVAGVEIEGRIGPVNLSFFADHIRSISGAQDTTGSSVEGRMDWLEQALKRFYSSPWVGVGFGQPLIDALDSGSGAAIRQPHNSSLSVAARLGVIGFALWVAFHLCLLQRFVYAFRRRHQFDKLHADLILWLFIFYLIFMIVMHVEPGLEFPSGAIPFYFFVGLILGMIRWQIPAVGAQAGRESLVSPRAGTALSPASSS